MPAWRDSCTSRRSPSVALSVLFLLHGSVSAAAQATTYPTPYTPHGAAAALSDIDPCNYGWNNNNSNPPACRGTITEGCASYHNGPACWNNGENPKGAYGWINLGKMANTSAECPPIPAQGIGELLGPKTPLFPRSMADALTPPVGSNLCFLACNISEVMRTGVDPCNKGSIPAGKPLPSWLLPPLQPFGTPEILPTPLEMNCYYGGKGWMKDPTMGMCGYKISMRNSRGQYCTSMTQPEGCPDLNIDPRRVPCCGGSARCAASEAAQPPLCCSCKQQ